MPSHPARPAPARPPSGAPASVPAPGWAGSFSTGAAIVGLSSYVPTVLQRGLGESLLTATLLVLVWSAVSTVTALAVRFVPGLDGRVLLALALAVCAVGLAGYTVLDADA